MRSFLINKNLSLYYFLKRMIGKKWGFVVAGTIEKAILIFGREELPNIIKNETPTDQ
ncbi:MAG TPA: hypothetical protein VLK23_07860 [Thermodesulfobacteriota bacterium]|nr:hypothetical protein [Thermodesulfobacteriota bacterium]